MKVGGRLFAAFLCGSRGGRFESLVGSLFGRSSGRVTLYGLSNWPPSNLTHQSLPKAPDYPPTV